MHDTYSSRWKLASPKSFSGDTEKSHVNWISKVHGLAESLEIMQLCCLSEEACFSRAHGSQPHSLFLKPAGHGCRDWRWLRHRHSSRNSNASPWDSWLIISGDKNSQGTPQPKRVVSAYTWHNCGNYDVGLRYDVSSNPAHGFELVCIEPLDSYLIRAVISSSMLA